MLLSACAHHRLTLPPDELIEDCAGPALTKNPVHDLPAYERAIQDCNADKAALRAWRDELRGRSR